MKSMSPHRKYHWCNFIALRKLFQVIFFDLYRPNFHYSLGYWFVFAVYLLAAFGCIYTFFFYDPLTTMFTMAAASGTFQVFS